MTIDQTINLLAAAALVALMITVGLGASLSLVGSILLDWRCMLRAGAANYLVVPAAAVGLVLLLDADPMVAAGAMIIAICPGAPFGPPFTALAKGRVDLAVALMVVLAGSSALLAPLLLQLLLPIVAPTMSATVDAFGIVRSLALLQFVPLCAGLALVTWRPTLAGALRRPFARLSTLLNLSLLAVIIVAQYPQLATIRPRGYLASIVLLAVSALAGWLLGGRRREDRKTLAITTAVRNVGVGLVIAGGNFPGTAAVTATTAYALVQTVITLIVVISIGRRAANPEADAASANALLQPQVIQPSATRLVP